MSREKSSTKKAMPPSLNRAVTTNDSPVESALLGAMANNAPDKSIESSCPSASRFTKMLSEDKSTCDIRARNLGTPVDTMLPANGANIPVIHRADFLSFQPTNIEKTSLVETFIFLLTIDQFGLQKATYWAKEMDWKLLPGLYELSSEACERLSIKPSDARK